MLVTPIPDKDCFCFCLFCPSGLNVLFIQYLMCCVSRSSWVCCEKGHLFTSFWGLEILNHKRLNCEKKHQPWCKSRECHVSISGQSSLWSISEVHSGHSSWKMEEVIREEFTTINSCQQLGFSKRTGENVSGRKSCFNHWTISSVNYFLEDQTTELLESPIWWE